MELGVQVLVSLMIGVVLAIPLIFLYMLWQKAKIKKKTPLYDLKNEIQAMKGGKNAVQKEKPRNYGTANSEFIRDYSERKFFGRSTEEPIGSLGRGNEIEDIKRKLANPSDYEPTGIEPIGEGTHRGWKKL